MPQFGDYPSASSLSGSETALVLQSGAVKQATITALLALVVDAAPGALDTLNELAAALADDPSFATTVTNALAAKEPLGEYIGINAQTGTTYTFALSDKGWLVTGSNASAQTYTVPPNSSVAFPVKSKIDLVQLGAGQITVAAGSGVTIRAAPGLKISGQYYGASLTKIGTDEWLLTGGLSA